MHRSGKVHHVAELSKLPWRSKVTLPVDTNNLSGSATEMRPIGESHGVQVQQASKSIEGLEGTDIIHSTNRKCPPTIDEKALVRRIDYRLLPVLFIIYLAAFLDR